MSRAGLTLRLVLSVAVICVGSLQFGYHMAELNAPELVLSCKSPKPGRVPYLDSYFGKHGYAQCIPLTADQVGLVTSIFSIGGLLGSLYVGKVANSIGRRKTALLHNFIYALGSFVSGAANSYVALAAGRFISGAAAGLAIVITSLFINEIAPPSCKGVLGLMNQVSINVGILATQLLALRWSNDNDWRWLLFAACGIALFGLVVTLSVDELPMWLAENGNSGAAFAALHRLRGGEYADLRAEVSSWQLEEGHKSVLLQQYLVRPEYRPSRTVATGILVLQQFCGINSIIFYGVSVLVSIFPTKSALINCAVSIVNLVVTFSAAPLVDSLGRKPLLLTSVGLMGLLTVLLGLGILSQSSFLSVAGTFVYITFFAVGLGPIPFLLVGEVTQPQAKALAQSWGVTLNWIATFVVGYTFPVLMKHIGGAVYFIFAAMCALTFVFVLRVVPETKGRHTYEEVWGLAT